MAPPYRLSGSMLVVSTSCRVGMEGAAPGRPTAMEEALDAFSKITSMESPSAKQARKLSLIHI